MALPVEAVAALRMTSLPGRSVSVMAAPTGSKTPQVATTAGGAASREAGKLPAREQSVALQATLPHSTARPWRDVLRRGWAQRTPGRQSRPRRSVALHVGALPNAVRAQSRLARKTRRHLLPDTSPSRDRACIPPPLSPRPASHSSLLSAHSSPATARPSLLPTRSPACRIRTISCWRLTARAL
jgi:hypothetical protein